MKRQNLCKRKGVHAVSLLLAALAVTFICTTAFAAGFTDLPQNHWAYSAVSEAAADGVMNGVGNSRFDPNGNVTLAQFLVILTRTYWPDEIAVNESTGSWYAKNFGVASNHNLFRVLYTPGVQEEYDYNDPITRAMMAQLVCNAMIANGAQNVSDIQSVLRQIPDVSPNHQFAEGIAFCYSRGILQGVDKAGNFSPEGTLTRAQTATIYVRCKNVLAGKSPSDQQETQTKQPEDPSVVPAPAPNTDTHGMSSECAELLALINAKRANAGLKALTVNDNLVAGAKLRADDISKGYMDERADGSKWDSVITGLPATATDLHETMTGGSGTASGIFAIMSADAEASAAMLNESYTQIGIGHMFNADGFGGYTDFWSLLYIKEIPSGDLSVIVAVPADADNLEVQRQGVLALVNAVRAQNGAAPLTLDESLCNVAQLRADEIVQSFSHTRPNGSSCFTAISEANISHSTAAENIAAGSSTPDDVMSQWMNSDGHRANILNPSLKSIGIGYMKVDSGYQHYWVQMFIG